MLWPMCGAQAETLWVAEARVIATTTQCANTTGVGDFFRAIFRPRGVPIGNGADSQLALFSQRTSFWMRVPNNSFRFGVNYTGHIINSSLTFTSKAGGILDWSESAPFGAPAISNVTASIANFYGTTGCTATLRMPFNMLP
jgi:hypothetical protein